MKRIGLIVYIILLIGCVPKSKYDMAMARIDSLKLENNKLQCEKEELMNGESRLIDLIDYSIANKKYLNALKFINLLQEKHPQSKKIISLQSLMQIISLEAKNEQAIVEKAIADSIRLSNINELGIWEIGYYEDQFGRKTGKKFILGSTQGTFSNTATNGSPLRVDFLINEKGYVYMQLFEYDSSNPLKSSYTKKFMMIVTSIDGNNFAYELKLDSSGYLEIWTSNYFGGENIIEIYNLFKTSKLYSCKVWEVDNSTSKYFFKINPSYFENALLKAGIETL